MISQKEKSHRPVFWDSASWRQAAVDLAVTQCAPASLPLETRQQIVRDLRAGTDPAAIATRTLTSRTIIEKLKKLLRNSNTVDDVWRNNSGGVAREAALLVGMAVLAVALVLWIGMQTGLIAHVARIAP